MKNARWLRASPLLIAAITSALFAACADTVNAPTAPAVPVKTLIHPLGPRGEYSSINGHIVVVQDEYDGTLYTFDADAKKVSNSDGITIVLDPDQASAMYALFLSVATADANYADATAACSPETCTVRDYSAINGASVPPLPTANPDLRKLFGPGFKLPKEFTTATKTKSSGGVSPFLFDSYCGNLVLASGRARSAYRPERTSFFKSFFWSAVAEGANHLADYVLPAGTITGARLLIDGTDVITENIRTALLNTLWNTHNCGDRNVIVGPIWTRGNGGADARDRPDLCSYVPDTFEWADVYYDITYQYCPATM